VKAVGWLISLAVLAFLLACAGAMAPLSLLLHTVFGWILFLGRSAREVTINWAGVVTLVLTVVAFVVGSHLLIRRLFRGADPESPAWRWRWTLGGAGLVLVMFVAGTAIVGVAHQLVWLARADEPLVASNSYQFRAAAVRTQSRNNLHNIGIAIHDYHDEFGTFPAGGDFDRIGVPQHSWQTRLLPYVDQSPLHQKLDLAEPWSSGVNRHVFAVALPVYQNPGFRNRERREHDDRGYALSHYAANSHVMGGGFGLPLGDIPDGASNTFAGGEVAGGFRPWGDPLNWRDPALGINRHPAGFGSPFERGAHVLVCDGSVRFVSEDIAPTLLKTLATPAGGEAIPEW
jgi:hypothetical protein